MLARAGLALLLLMTLTRCGRVVADSSNEESREETSITPPKGGGKGTDAGEPGKLSCLRTGCSGQVCAKDELITTCEWRPEYTCFQQGRCEAQSNGNCAFTWTNELESCLGCSPPLSGLHATFLVRNERFSTWVVTPAAIDLAIGLWRGTSAARIPLGRTVCKPAAWNCGWSWHLDPATVTFAEQTIELCDGRPSYIEEDCTYGAGRFCPWGATMVRLRDCRTDPTCPDIPK